MPFAPVTTLRRKSAKNRLNVFSRLHVSPANSPRKPKCRAVTLKSKDGVRPSGPASPGKHPMENQVTRSIAARPSPPPPVLPGNASFPQNPPDASPDFDLSSQPTETEQLKTLRLITRHTPRTCVSQLAPLSGHGGAYCKNAPPDAPPDFDPCPQPTETEELKTPRLITSHSPRKMRPRPPPVLGGGEVRLGSAARLMGTLAAIASAM